MSAYGYKRTFRVCCRHVRFTPESGHSEFIPSLHAYGPKRTSAALIEALLRAPSKPCPVGRRQRRMVA